MEEYQQLIVGGLYLLTFTGAIYSINRLGKSINEHLLKNVEPIDKEKAVQNHRALRKILNEEGIYGLEEEY